MPQPNLIYVADPMCSWCWGFSPVIDAVTERFGASLPFRLVLGGLRPGTKEPMDEHAKRTIREHWEHVQKASGQPYDFAFFEREGFVYDSEPPSRAVVVARRSGRALAALAAIHRAFYAENRDVTDPSVLADVAAGIGLDRTGFLDAFEGEEARQETWADFALAQRAGIRGFPTLLAGDDAGGEYRTVTHGFQPADRIVPVLDRWLAALQAANRPEAGRIP